MKRVIFSVLMIAIVGSLVGIGTWAYFTDYETSYDNIFTAGKLDLKVDNIDDPLPVYFDETCLMPCDEGQVEITLMNDGCVPGMLNIQLYNLEDNENDVAEPEETMGDTGPDGELAENMWMEMWADCTGGTNYDSLIIEGYVADIEDDLRYFCDCIADQEVVGLLITWEIDCEVGNEIMTDSIAFDIEFSLEQEPCMYDCWLDVTGFDQPASVVQGSPYNFDVLVHCDCAGEEGACSGTVYVEVKDATGATVWAGSQYIADQPYCDTVPVSFSMDTAGVAVGLYTVVADTMECPFEILEPGALAVTDIQQPPFIQICEDLSVGIDIHNTGGVPTEGMVFTCVVDPLGTPLVAPQFVSTGVIDPCETVKVAVDFGHVGEGWRGGGAVVAGFPADPLDPQEEELFICPMGFLLPATFEVTGIQQPAGLQPCEDIVIAVDVHNYGDKPGACDVVTMWIEDELGMMIHGPVYGATGVLEPCDTEKVPFASVHADPAWLDTTITVYAQACGGVPVECDINVVGGPCIEVTGIQQPEEINVCDELVVSVDVHNAGGKPGECYVDVWVEDELGMLIAGPFSADVPLLAPCDEEKIPFVIGHVDETWVPGIVVWAVSCCGDPVTCPIVVIPPPEPPVPPVSCWAIYLVNWWVGEAEPTGLPDNVEYFAMHCVELLPAGYTEDVGPPFPGDQIVIPDPSWHQELTAFAGPLPNGYTIAAGYDKDYLEWDLLPNTPSDPPPSIMKLGVSRFNSILQQVYATGVGYWNSSLTMLNWKSRFDVNTGLGPITLYACTLSVTPMVGNPGWPWAVGNSWASLGMSSITAPTTTYTEVVGTATITTPLFPGGIECYVVEASSWDDTLGVEPGVPEPIELTLSGTKWMHNDYGAPIKNDAYPGALYLGWETQDMIWYCQNPPFPPF